MGNRSFIWSLKRWMNQNDRIHRFAPSTLLLFGYGVAGGGYAQIRPQPFHGFCPEPAHAAEVVDGLERAVLLAVIENVLGERVADLGERDQLRLIGGVQIDLVLHCKRVDSVDFNQSAAQAALRDPVVRHRPQGEQR